MRTSVLLRKVRNFFREKGEKGWTKHELLNAETGAVCINGAVNKILYDNPNHYQIRTDPVYKRLRDVLLYPYEKETSDIPAYAVAKWNNSTTFQNLMARIEKACREHR